jgi:hypothetical protein
MGTYLMDHFLERERLKTFLKLCRAYRPTLSIQFLVTALGFAVPGEPITKMSERETIQWLRSKRVAIQDGLIDCKASSSIIGQQVAHLDAKGVDIKGQIH